MRYLVALSLGPVQSLIGAARRTRDLWCGSWLLSEAARAAAAHLHHRHPGSLVFPHIEDSAELRSLDAPGDVANFANILRAEVFLPDSGTARALCAETKAAAVARLTALGADALARLGEPVRDDVWRAQIDDILEGFAAWVAVPDGDYPAAGDRLSRALAARKATRDFRPCVPLTRGLPKSSLDGARETVLPNWPREHHARRRLALDAGEQLDALGVIKRLAGDVEQFTAYPRIAADPWIRRLDSEPRERLAVAYEPLVSTGSATRVRGNAGVYAALPYDGLLLFPPRLDKALSDADDPATQQALETMHSCIREIIDGKTEDGGRVGAPVPYAAILKADGDRMGSLLPRANSVAASRAISRSLHGFASNVRKTVRSHHGHAVYSGGDDVLALVPLPSALACARALAEDFSSRMIEVGAKPALGERPTLSVGLGVGHVMEPLNVLRDRAERAERLAKGDAAGKPRNAVGIVLGVRSGSEHSWRARWDDAPALDAMARFVDAFRRGSLPARLAYELRGIEERMFWLRGDCTAQAQDMRRAELNRLLDRARIRGGGQTVPEDMRRFVLERAQGRPLGDLTSTLIIARWLSARTDADVGEGR